MSAKLANTMDIKRRNLARTLRCILACEHISLLDLTRKLSLSGTSVLQNVKILTERGLAREVGSYESTGGRKARAYAPLRDARLAIGLDLTKNHISAVLINLAGQIEHFQRERIPFSTDDEYLRKLGLIAGGMAKGFEEKILGVGISLPGIIDKAQNRLLYSHVLNLRNFPLDIFRQHVPFGCGFINDANSAGLAEVYEQNIPGVIVYLSLSGSVGGAVFNEGSLYAGQNLRAGEWGHTTVVPNGRQCYCGNRGCLDAYCSASLLSDQTGGNLEEFFRLLAAGDGKKLASWRECLHYLAIAVNNINMALDCDVIIGGYLGSYLEKFGGDFPSILAERNTFKKDASYLRYCRYKKEAAAVGAALTYMRDFIELISQD